MAVEEDEDKAGVDEGMSIVVDVHKVVQAEGSAEAGAKGRAGKDNQCQHLIRGSHRISLYQDV